MVIHSQVAELAAAASKCGCDDDRRSGSSGKSSGNPVQLRLHPHSENVDLIKLEKTSQEKMNNTFLTAVDTLHQLLSG